MKILLTPPFALLLLFSACDWEERIPTEMVTTTQSQPLGKEKSVDADVRVDVGSLEISSNSSPNVYSVEMEYDKARFSSSIQYNNSSDRSDEGRLSLRLETRHEGRIGPRGAGARLRLNLSSELPMKLNLRTGVGEARLSLSGLKLSRLDLESGVGGTRISAFEPNSVPCDTIRFKNGVGGLDATGLANLNFRNLEFEGGVGGANLDFTGEWKHDADIRVQVGVGGVSLRMPREIGVRVETEKHFLSGMHLDDFNQRDSYYFSRNYDQASIHVSVRVMTGIGGFRVTWA